MVTPLHKQVAYESWVDIYRITPPKTWINNNARQNKIHTDIFWVHYLMAHTPPNIYICTYIYIYTHSIYYLNGRNGPTEPAESPKDVSVQVQAAMDQQGPLRFLAVPEFHTWNEGPLPESHEIFGKLERKTPHVESC
jgi:hypothetical protein